ncbi:DUF3953 domain-containing protein [Salimicrobium halophilum]|uniref:DUF3953 domain-containing protein n=1 Tax=Salimicrobium halophilum TaxID=86666 RepID=A0A1G8QXD9_9BACI|nr:DUF3953 domain-containing protein [Salimicrobium halophilum]SDJ09386.1 Protein of unknown function [Salimicrobium halophilum]
MKKLRVILAGVVIVLAGLTMMSDISRAIMPYAMIVVTVLVFMMGVMEFRRRNPVAFTLFVAGGFTLFVGVYTI